MVQPRTQWYRGRGTPWYSMVYHSTTAMCHHTVVSWYTMVCHGKLWDTMDCAPWYTVVNHGNPWYIMVQQYTITHRSRTVVYHGVPWYTMV